MAVGARPGGEDSPIGVFDDEVTAPRAVALPRLRIAREWASDRDDATTVPRARPVDWEPSGEPPNAPVPRLDRPLFEEGAAPPGRRGAASLAATTPGWALASGPLRAVRPRWLGWVLAGVLALLALVGWNVLSAGHDSAPGAAARPRAPGFTADGPASHR